MKIAVITHKFDRRWAPAPLVRWPWQTKRFLIDDVVETLAKYGHELFYVSPEDTFRPADAAILHYDETRIGDPARELAARYPFTLNGHALDISKRKVSRNLLTAESGWSGQVIVKSDLNCTGSPERRHSRRAYRHEGHLVGGQPRKHNPYTVYDTLADVPGEVWANPDWVVEKFLPETSAGGFALRIWVKLGSYERCNLYESPEKIVKVAGVKRVGPVPVPDEMRAEADRLGLDFGKFDFTIHDGVPVLLDANKTPGYTSSIGKYLAEAGPAMADAFLKLAAEAR